MACTFTITIRPEIQMQLLAANIQISNMRVQHLKQGVQGWKEIAKKWTTLEHDKEK
jgi:hypothetical protein